MANSGTVIHLDPARHYEDLTSLKKYLWATGNQDIEERIISANMLTTGATEIEVESTDSVAIAQIGKAELTLVLSGDADNASTSGKTYTLVYYDSDGDSHTCVGTGTSDLNSNAVAFVPACSDFYCAYSFTASATDANVNVIAKVAGGATYATVAIAATTATEANLLGVGAVYGRAHTNHADSAGEIQYLCYINPWGEKKFGHCTHGADGTDEIRFFVGTDAGDGTVTATTTTVKDFYRIIRYWVPVAPTANSHEFFLTDAACANVDGSGGDVYGVVRELEYESINTRCHARQGYKSYLGQVIFTCPTVAAADSFTGTIYLTPLTGDEQGFPIIFGGSGAIWDCPIEVKPETDVYFTILDAATAATLGIQVVFVEVEQ